MKPGFHLSPTSPDSPGCICLLSLLQDPTSQIILFNSFSHQNIKPRYAASARSAFRVCGLNPTMDRTLRELRNVIRETRFCRLIVQTVFHEATTTRLVSEILSVITSAQAFMFSYKLLEICVFCFLFVFERYAKFL